jgi:hypothetical protein
VLRTLPKTAKHISHQHALKLTLSSQLNQFNHQICRLCVKEVETDRVYYCSKCNFVAHLNCATGDVDYMDATFMLEFKDKQPLESTSMLQNEDSKLDESIIDSLAYVVKKMKIEEAKIEIAEEINHFSHQHDLKLTEELLNNEQCDGCMLPISTSPSPQFYSCAQCKFFLHKSCVEFPEKSDTQYYTPTSSPYSQRPLMLLAGSFVMFVVVYVMASPTIVRNASLMQMSSVV